MSRIILSEYAAKKLLVGETYQGISLTAETDFSQESFLPGLYVVKVDEGIKKRNQKGLVSLGLNGEEALVKASEYLGQGYKRILIEPLINHNEEEEQYISCTLVRSGVSVLYSKSGGNHVEDKSNVIEKSITRADFISGSIIEDEHLPTEVVTLLLSAMRQFSISFIEINPFIISTENKLIFLDAALELDSTKLHLLPEWVSKHVIHNAAPSDTEADIAALNENSTASFSLTIFDKDASVFTILSGGGASLVGLDTFVDCGMQQDVANYGEYSGAPSREETYQYARAILSLLFQSSAPRKVLVIAGGVANFTDVTTTFSGILDSCEEYIDEFKKQSVMVVVRRGGPRQTEGLAMLQSFFTKHNIPAVVSDPSMPLSHISIEAKKFIEHST